MRGWAAFAALLTGLAFSPARAVDAWGPEENLSRSLTDSETGLNHAPMAITPDGALHVVWAERDSPNDQYRIWTKRHAPWLGWSAAELVVDYPVTDPGDPGDNIGAKYPALAVAANGDLEMFWHDYRVGGIDNVEIFTKVRPAGGEWDSSRSADIRLTTTDHSEVLGDNGYVPMPVAASGAMHVVWFDYRWDGLAAEICSKTRPAGGAWDLTPGDSADVRVTNDPGHSELVDVAADAVGDLHAVWRSVGGGASILYARLDAGTGLWSAAVDIDGGGMVQGAPAIAVGGSDRVHVVWPDARDGGRALFTTVLDAGTWSLPARLTRPADGADEPALAVADDGTVHLVFSDGRWSLLNREIVHRPKPSGAPWDTTYASDSRISNAPGSSSRPSVLTDGPFVQVLWKDARSGINEIYFRRGGPGGTDVPPPASRSGLVAWPNPLREGTRVRSGAGGPLGAIEIVDVTGRRVRRLVSSGGIATWDGRDARGRRVPAGVYFARTNRREALPLTVVR